MIIGTVNVALALIVRGYCGLRQATWRQGHQNDLPMIAEIFGSSKHCRAIFEDNPRPPPS